MPGKSRPIVPNWFYRQSAVIPFVADQENIRFLLISNHKRTKWIIPKGVVEPQMTPAQSAAREALEEAGIRGTVCERPVGSYQYKKWGGVCHVEVFLFQIEEILADWPERACRWRIWAGRNEAVRFLTVPELKALIKQIDRSKVEAHFSGSGCHG